MMSKKITDIDARDIFREEIKKYLSPEKKEENIED
jgi:hypothetical protein